MLSSIAFSQIAISPVAFSFEGGAGAGTVPYVRDLTRTAAIALLEAAGYVVVVREAFDSFVLIGSAIRTAPPAGTSLSASQTVTLYISRSVLFSIIEARPVFNYPVEEDATSIRIRVRILNLDGTPRTGVGYNTSSLAFTARRGASAAVPITLMPLVDANAAWSSGGFAEIGNGDYVLDVPNALLVEGVRTVYIDGNLTNAWIIGAQMDLSVISSGGGGGGGEVDVKYMNGVRIVGDGTRGNLFRGDPTLP